MRINNDKYKTKIMTMKGFGMGFFGKNHCDSDGIKKFQEKWAEMTDEHELCTRVVGRAHRCAL